MNEIARSILSAEFVYSVIRVSTPLIFAVMGALLSEIAGVINIALEGMMLMAAFWGVIVSAFTGSAWLGMLAGLASAVLLALALAYFHLNLRTNLILAGIALNLFASGATVFLLYLISGDKGSSASIKSYVLPRVDIPLLKDIPFFGDALSGHHILTYLAFAAVVFVQYLIYRTPLGLRLRAVGENPEAAESVGISVRRVRYIALVLSGLMAGFGGVFLSMGYVSWFARDMTSGRGFIALAAQALGGKTAIGGMLGAMLFGLAEALSYTFQAIRIPSEFTNMMPFVFTLIALAVYARSVIARHRKAPSSSQPLEENTET
ncbi:MAG: ral nucleoside transport system permease protein [Thermotogota bacterium]|nr:ral nucleoside transport system permease protein [Thermotogota bacterium]MDK2864913.1 ral nucleoside transport system permease protein [Thermotogota bacterium]HCZ06282.1 ABC transporter permease [Thermotogota bacterium]